MRKVDREIVSYLSGTLHFCKLGKGQVAATKTESMPLDSF